MTVNLLDLDIEKGDKRNNYFYCMKRLFPYIKPYLPRTILALAVSVPIGLLDGTTAYVLKPFIDQLNGSFDMRFVIGIPVLIVLFSLVQGIFSYLSAYLNTWVGSKINMDIKNAMFQRLLKYESTFYNKNSTGIIVTRFSGDVEGASNGLISNVRTFLTRLFSAISLIYVLLTNSWQLAIVAVMVLGFAFIPLAYLRKKMKFLSKEGVKLGSNIYTIYNETCSGNRTIAAYNLQEAQNNKFDCTLQRAFYLGIKGTQAYSIITPLMQFITSIGIALVIGFSAYLIKTHQITTGSLFSFIAALILLYQPIKTLGAIAAQAQNSVFAIGRILGLMDAQEILQDKENAVELQEVKNSITFEDVTFSYEENKPVLKNINLEVKVGETLALVGNSGGGKSSLVSLIPRFYDVVNGAIKIDGVDIKDIKLSSLRDKMAVVFQDNFLFAGTIRENILLGKPSATEEELNEAVKNAYLFDFINSLENGLDTDVGERGVLLSGGQKQRVAIARAFIKNASIIILDEATSALDNKSEAVVQQAIENLMKNKTVFVIAHRLSTVQHATRIAVIDDGQIIEIGNHEQLLDIKDGIYKNLYYAQFKVKEEAQQPMST